MNLIIVKEEYDTMQGRCYQAGNICLLGCRPDDMLHAVGEHEGEKQHLQVLAVGKVGE